MADVLVNGLMYEYMNLPPPFAASAILMNSQWFLFSSLLPSVGFCSSSDIILLIETFRRILKRPVDPSFTHFFQDAGAYFSVSFVVRDGSRLALIQSHEKFSFSCKRERVVRGKD